MYNLNSFPIGHVAKSRMTQLSMPILWLKKRPALLSSSLFFASTTLVNLGNYLFNLILGRRLGPTLFADLSVMVTLLLILTFATTAISTTVAKFTASYVAQGEHERVAALRTWIGQRTFGVGCMFALVFCGSARFMMILFHMRSPLPFIMLGCGMPLFFLLAVDRGILQGQANFQQLALSQQAEMWTRLLGSLALVMLGWSVNGAVGGVVFSFVVAWYVARWVKRGLPTHVRVLDAGEQTKIVRYIGPVVLGLIGQMIINNSDILIVKSFFPASSAGQYAALALIGRMVFFATWSVVMVMFPYVTQRQQRGETHRSLLWLSLGIVTLVSCGIVLVSFMMPEFIVNIFFGNQYTSIAGLLGLYALATAFYALANVIVTYHLSLGNGKGNYIVLAAGIAQVVGLLSWHTTLAIVVLVQVGIMGMLLLVLLTWDKFRRKEYI